MSAERRVLDKAAAQLGEVHVEHHDDEQEQHRHRADVDDDQDHRQELGAEQHEQPRRVEEREDEEQHRRAQGSRPTIDHAGRERHGRHGIANR